MATASGVEVQLSSIEKAWQQAGGADLWLRLRTRAGTLADFASAAADLNDEAEARGQEGAWAEAPGSAPDGFVLLLTRCADRDVLRRWSSDFADRLAQHGLSGKLQGAPRVRQPGWLPDVALPTPTAFLAWSPDFAAMAADPHRSSHWHVPADVTRRIASLADRWARQPGAALRLWLNVWEVAVDLDDATEPLARSLLDTGMAGLQFVDDERQQLSHVAFDPGGTGLFQLVGGPEDWRSRVTRLTAVLTALPADTAVGFLRAATRGSTGIEAIDSVQPLPGIQEYHVRYNKHLLERFVPDAHGIQVLRTAHLDRVRDLSGWDVTALDSDRFLVRARDLTPWYGQALPDADVLARARADFAGALLTEEVIAAHPPPW